MNKLTREQLYDAQIAPLMDRILDLAEAYEIPIFATFQLTGPNEVPGVGPLFVTCSRFYPWADEDLWKAYNHLSADEPGILVVQTGPELRL